MFYLMAAFCVGPIILYCSGELLPDYSYILYAIACIPLINSRHFLPAVFFMLGLLYAQFAAQSQIGVQSELAFSEDSEWVDTYLCSLPLVYPRYSKAEFCVLDSPREELVGRKLILAWPQALNLDSSSRFFKLNVRLKPVRGTLNFNGSSLEQYLFYRKVVGRGQVLEVVGQGDSKQAFSLRDDIRWQINSNRVAMGDHLERFLSEAEHGGLIRALLLGDKSLIKPHEAQSLRYTGTQHLLAISGLHVGLIMFLLFRLFPSGAWGISIVSGLGLAYVLMVGAGESALRAWVMVTLALIFMRGRWRRSYCNVYVFALFAVILVDPLSPMNIGFWYSFLCVALLLVFSQVSQFAKVNGSSMLQVQIVLILGMAPINALNGSVHGLSALLANIISVPWVSMLVLPLVLVSFLISFISPDLASVLFQCSDIALQLLIQYLSSLPKLFSEFSLEASLWVLVLYALVILGIVFSVRILFLRHLLVLVLFLVLCRPVEKSELPSEVLVFDAGQGLSIGLIWANQYWLYDTGLDFGAYSLAERAIFPYFRSHEQLKSLTGLITSHGDADHAGGAPRVNEYLQPGISWSGEPGRVAGLEGENPCVVGMLWSHGEGLVEVLYPFERSALKALSANNHSCVVRFTYKGFVFLLMGDLEGEAEMRLVENYKGSLKADVLIAGHHGAANSSSFALLKHVQPEYVVISAGYKNRFGHPHRTVIERVEAVGGELLSTASLGALRFDLSGDELVLVSARQKRRDFWYAPAESM